MLVNYDIGRLRADILTVFINGALAEKTRFGNWLASVLVEEEERRDRPYADDQTPSMLILPQLEDHEVERAAHELANSIIHLQDQEHACRQWVGQDEHVAALLEGRRFLAAIGNALLVRGQMHACFMADASAEVVN